VSALVVKKLRKVTYSVLALFEVGSEH